MPSGRRRPCEATAPALNSSLLWCRIKDIIRHHEIQGRGVSWTITRTETNGYRRSTQRPANPATWSDAMTSNASAARSRRRPSSATPDPTPSTPTPISSRRGSRTRIPGKPTSARGPVPPVVPGTQPGPPPGHLIPRRRLPRTPSGRPGRPPAVTPQQEATPGRPAALLRQPADVSRRRPQPRRLRPRAQILGPRGQDPRLRRQAGRPPPPVDRHRQHDRPPRQDPADGPCLHRRPRGRRPPADHGLPHRRAIVVLPLRREGRQAPPGARPGPTSSSRWSST